MAWFHSAESCPCYCISYTSATLESARKKALDNNYTSSDEEIGRGKRKKKQRRNSTSTADEGSEGCEGELVLGSGVKLKTNKLNLIFRLSASTYIINSRC